MTMRSDLVGSATIELMDGTGVRIPPLQKPPDVTGQDLRNVTTGLIVLIESLDKRLAAVEKKLGA